MTMATKYVIQVIVHARQERMYVKARFKARRVGLDLSDASSCQCVYNEVSKFEALWGRLMIDVEDQPLVLIVTL
jgi:hypothetical protein